MFLSSQSTPSPPLPSGPSSVQLRSTPIWKIQTKSTVTMVKLVDKFLISWCIIRLCDFSHLNLLTNNNKKRMDEEAYTSQQVKEEWRLGWTLGIIYLCNFNLTSKGAKFNVTQHLSQCLPAYWLLPPSHSPLPEDLCIDLLSMFSVLMFYIASSSAVKVV